MSDTTIKKVQSAHSPKGAMGQTYLVAGKQLSMRLWEEEPSTDEKTLHERDYETVGYVMSGGATLELDGQTISLEPGDCWLVPAHAPRRYRIEETFSAVEATSPPAELHGRDSPVNGGKGR
jgi:quercetin dioxygenase-like cupin family protein